MSLVKAFAVRIPPLIPQRCSACSTAVSRSPARDERARTTRGFLHRLNRTGVTYYLTGSMAQAWLLPGAACKAARMILRRFFVLLPVSVLVVALSSPSVRSDAVLPSLPGIAPDQPFTFAVLGDHRGDSDGNVPPVLLEIFESINRDAPAFAISTGDIINGYPEEEEPHIRKLWAGYRKALQKLKPPIFHAPGNHDIFNEVSTRLWAELIGPTRYAFDAGAARFIVLDSETVPGRIDAKQLEWLRSQLASAEARRVFIFVHQPLFPVDGHIGSSLDKFPAERDRLHALIAEHRAKVDAVFVGHEHLFHFERRDGVAYYITAGSGAPLYVPQELGGFYHYLLVRVGDAGSEIALRKLRTPDAATAPARLVQPNEVLESWEHAVLWTAWDQTVGQELVLEPVTNGTRALKLSFNPAHYEWPTLSTTFAQPRDLADVERVKADVFVAENAPEGLVVKGGIEGAGNSETPPIPLKRGWNTLVLDLNAPWLSPADRKQARLFRFAFGGRAADALQPVVIDNIRAERTAAATKEHGGESVALFESWEAPLMWTTWDEAQPSADTKHVSNGEGALRLDLDFIDRKRPTLYSRLQAPWDLSKVEGLALDVYASDETSDLSVTFGLTGEMETCRSPKIPLKRGPQTISVGLEWVSTEVRKNVRQIQLIFASNAPEARTAVVVDHLHALGH